MKLSIFQVDAFADTLFEGNPAAVIPLQEWLDDSVMQKIALENNLSETAFFVEEPEGLRIRWFTPAAEVKLCGHATLATAHVLFNHLGYTKNKINFNSRSGILSVEKSDDLLTLDFPVSDIQTIPVPEEAEKITGTKPVAAIRGRDDLMFVYSKESQIQNMAPNFLLLEKFDSRGLIVTAQGKNYDFVSRFFAPAVGINEDPVTGSAHTMLIPYWAKELGKNKLKARQLSKRGGTVYCQLNNERVLIAGKAVTYLEGKINL